MNQESGQSASVRIVLVHARSKNSTGNSTVRGSSSSISGGSSGGGGGGGSGCVGGGSGFDSVVSG